LNTEVGITLVLTEQHIKIARKLAHEFVIMDRGRIEESGAIDGLTDKLVHKHLTI
jgi:urea transport system ATP-binding protein